MNVDRPSFNLTRSVVESRNISVPFLSFPIDQHPGSIPVDFFTFARCSLSGPCEVSEATG